MQPILTVIICTHNPRRNYLERVLQALEAQTLPKEVWELLLIDNASDKVLSSEIDLTWHPQYRHIREEQLGLTPARLRGIKEAISETLVFVDDDNVLDEDYLEVALRISKDFPLLGAWGGQIRPEFEVAPPEWIKSYWWMLALRDFEKDKWSNLVNFYETVPCGAGLCVRKIVATKYLELLQSDLKRVALDRKGKQLTSCGDTDLAFTSCDLGLGTGQFVALKLIHLMPSSRVEEKYLLQLAEANGYSGLVLESFRGKIPSVPKLSWKGKLLKYYKRWRMNPQERRLQQAFDRGHIRAIQEILQTQG